MYIFSIVIFILQKSSFFVRNSRKCFQNFKKIFVNDEFLCEGRTCRVVQNTRVEIEKKTEKMRLQQMSGRVLSRASVFLRAPSKNWPAWKNALWCALIAPYLSRKLGISVYPASQSERSAEPSGRIFGTYHFLGPPQQIVKSINFFFASFNYGSTLTGTVNCLRKKTNFSEQNWWK